MSCSAAGIDVNKMVKLNTLILCLLLLLLMMLMVMLTSKQATKQTHKQARPQPGYTRLKKIDNAVNKIFTFLDFRYF